MTALPSRWLHGGGVCLTFRTHCLAQLRKFSAVQEGVKVAEVMVVDL